MNRSIINRMLNSARTRLLTQFISEVNNYYRSIGRSLVEEYYRELEDACRSLVSFGEYSLYAKFEAYVRHRLVIGTATTLIKHISEIGLDIDPTTSLPVIRGSAIKGAVRSLYESLDKKLAKELFGYSEKREAKIGDVVFFDAYPIAPGENGLLLVPEVITPMYRDSPQEHRARPVPLKFVCVNKGVKFWIITAVRLGAALKYSQAKEVLQTLEKYIAYTLERIGVGAKTSLGYSKFSVRLVKSFIKSS